MNRREEHLKQKTREMIQAKNLRTERTKELKAAIAGERSAARKQAIIEKHRNAKLLERNLLPGPGEYESKSDFETNRGFKIGSENPKSEIEWIIHRAKQTPGPGAYIDNMAYKSDTPTVSFSKGNVPSDLEWKIIRGPGTITLIVPSLITYSLLLYPYPTGCLPNFSFHHV